MTDFSVVGKSVIRVDAVDKATGGAIYASDIELPQMLYAKVLRSPHPHARIVSIDTSKAEQLPEVVCVLTSKDVPQKKVGMYVLDEDFLAKDIVRSIGAPVAAVAAESIEAAEEALELISVKYEPLPAIFDPEEAMSTDPPVVVHPDLFNYIYREPFAHKLDLDRPNVCCHHKIRIGDVEKGFQEADLILENRFSAQRVQHCTLEPRVAIAQPEADGGLTMWLGLQSFSMTRLNLARLFDIQPTKVRFIIPYIGGSFGNKNFREEHIAALLALRTRRPVKHVFTREEEFIRGGSRVPMIIYIKDGVKKDGTLVAREMKAILPTGGSTQSIAAVITRNCSFGAVGIYRVPNFKWDSYGVYTNGPPVGAFRGFGSTQLCWAIESHMDMLAERLGIKPVEIRRRNFLREGEPNATGEIMHSIGVGQCLEKVAEFIKLDEKPRDEGVWRRGKGISAGNKYSEAPTASIARVKVMEDGGITVYHGSNEVGQGCDTVMAQIAAEEFGISVDEVKIAFSDSLYMPFDHGTQSSRCTYHVGNAVRLACQDAKRQIFERVGRRLGLPPGDLETKGGWVYVKGMPEKKVQTSELFAGYQPEVGQWGFFTIGGDIMGNDTFAQGHAPEDPETGQIDPQLAAQGKRLTAFWENTAKAVELAVNTETGEVKVLRYAVATDMGQPINPAGCEQQAGGAMGMGIGAAIYEELKVEEGQITNPNFTDYKLPSTGEMPLNDKISIMSAPAPHKDGPYGAKGVGEGGLVGVDAAIANAVYNAVGVRIKDLPLSAEKLLKALRKKGKGSLG